MEQQVDHECELRKLMYTAQLPGKGTFVIRYPRGRGVMKDWECPLEEIAVGTGRKLRDGEDVAVLTLGPIGNLAQQAIEQAGISAAHYDMRFLKPMDERLLEEIGQHFKHIVTIEDGVRTGGLGSAVLEWMNDHEYQPKIVRIGLPDTRFVEHGTVDQLYKLCGMDVESIKKTILQLVKS